MAVQSHWFSVGAVVTWAEAGVGAVATQSMAEPAYGLRGLALMKRGMSAERALAALTSQDDAAPVRQVAFVDARGGVAAHTGDGCIESAGHHVGDGYSVQANMMLNDEVVPAMVEAFEAARGPLPERMVAALAGGQAAGGDIRGRQSAAILVVKGTSTGQPWADGVVELRVEDDANPIDELTRLLTLHRAYEQMNLGDAAVAAQEMKTAAGHYRTAAELAPDNVEMAYWHGVAMATNDQLDAAIPLFRRVFAADRNWAELTRRLFKPGVFPDTPEGHALVDRILREAS